MQNLSKGKLLIFSAPSGAGKTTIVKHLLEQNLGLEFSISATTRAPRGSEVNGKDYYFLSIDDFKLKIAQNDFLEWEEVYTDKFYGTLKSEVERITNSGKHVIFDVDVVGGINIKKYYQENALAIFIMPPSVEELEKRLRNRNTDSEEVIINRLAKSTHEISYAPQFDKIVINDELSKASAETLELVKNFIQ